MVRIIDALGAEGAGAVIDRSASLVRQMTDPDQATSAMLRQAIALDIAYVEATSRPPPLREFYDYALGKAVGPEHERRPLVQRSLELGKEFGDVCDALRRSTDTKSPGGKALTAHEESDLVKQVREMLDVGADLLNDIAAQHEAEIVKLRPDDR